MPAALECCNKTPLLRNAAFRLIRALRDTLSTIPPGFHSSVIPRLDRGISRLKGMRSFAFAQDDKIGLKMIDSVGNREAHNKKSRKVTRGIVRIVLLIRLLNGAAEEGSGRDIAKVSGDLRFSDAFTFQVGEAFVQKLFQKRAQRLIR